MNILATEALVGLHIDLSLYSTVLLKDSANSLSRSISVQVRRDFSFLSLFVLIYQVCFVYS